MVVWDVWKRNEFRERRVVHLLKIAKSQIYVVSGVCSITIFGLLMVGWVFYLWGFVGGRVYGGWVLWVCG
jgi:hypothetical protein